MLFLFGFALYYNSIYYNIALSSILIAACFIEKLTLFRFPKQGYFFVLLLLLMFVFRAAGGFGNVLLTLPFGVPVTDQGLWAAANFVLQILLLFLLFGVAIYSTPESEFVRYFNAINESESRLVQPFKSIARIAMYVAWLLPKSLEYKSDVSKELKGAVQKHAAGLKQRVDMVLERIYRFILNILERSELQYSAFLNKQGAGNHIPLVKLSPAGHVLVAVLILTVHASLTWY